VSLLRSSARRIISVDPSAKRRALSVELGASLALDPTLEDPVVRIKEETGERGADVAVEAVGKPETVELTARSLGRGGRLLIMGVCKPTSYSKLQPFDLVFQEKEIIGALGQIHEFPRAIDMVSTGVVPVHKLVTHEIPLAEIESGLQLVRSADCIKAIVKPG
jgi:threonine dehydrogenase-like Zn-dependent dehydrogenase